MVPSRTTHRFYINLPSAIGQYFVGLKWAENTFTGISPNATGPALVSQTHWYYDDYTYNPDNYDWWNQPGQYTQGLVTMVGRGLCCAAASFPTTRYAYDSWGNRVSETDALAHTTVTDYDDQLHLYPELVTSPIPTLTVSYQYYGIDGVAANGQAPGLLYQAIDPNGQAARYTYDAFGRLVDVYLPGDPAGDPGRPTRAAGAILTAIPTTRPPAGMPAGAGAPRWKGRRARAT